MRHQQFYTLIEYIPSQHRHLPVKEAWSDDNHYTDVFYIIGSLDTHVQLNWFDRQWAKVVDDGLTRSELAHGAPVIELADLEYRFPETLRQMASNRFNDEDFV
jgi:hypothetical protein